MRKLVVIPARGGSKGIPGKNIYPLNGKPLLSYTIEVFFESRLDDADIVVSTDSQRIMEVAREYRGVFVIERPADISGDKAKTEDALIHALDYMKDTYGREYDAVLTLQATSPLRSASTLNDFVRTFENNYPGYDAQLSLNEDRTDFWIQNTDLTFNRLFPDAPRRRQERKPLFKENSAYYITEVSVLRETRSVLGKRPNGYAISDIEAVDINEYIDIMIAEALIKTKYNKGE